MYGGVDLGSVQYSLVKISLSFTLFWYLGAINIRQKSTLGMNDDSYGPVNTIIYRCSLPQRNKQLQNL